MTLLVLASNSDVRKRLLAAVNPSFVSMPPRVDEAVLKQKFVGPVTDLAVFLARHKALSVCQNSDKIVIGADQVLEFNGIAYDKPASIEEARARFKTMRGKEHRLIGGLVLCRSGNVLWEHKVVCTLKFRNFSDEFLSQYLNEAGDIITGTVGGYAFERDGVQLFDSVKGDYFAILGLDLIPLLEQLRRLNVLKT